MSRSDTRSCRVPGCGEAIRFLQVGVRVVCVDAAPHPDGEFFVIGNYGYEVTPETPSDAPRYRRHNAECGAWMRMQNRDFGRENRARDQRRAS